MRRIRGGVVRGIILAASCSLPLTACSSLIPNPCDQVSSQEAFFRTKPGFPVDIPVEGEVVQFVPDVDLMNFRMPNTGWLVSTKIPDDSMDSLATIKQRFTAAGFVAVSSPATNSSPARAEFENKDYDVFISMLNAHPACPSYGPVATYTVKIKDPYHVIIEHDLDPHFPKAIPIIAGRIISGTRRETVVQVADLTIARSTVDNAMTSAGFKSISTDTGTEIFDDGTYQVQIKFEKRYSLRPEAGPVVEYYVVSKNGQQSGFSDN